MTESTTHASRRQFWQRQIEAWRASGQSRRAFCKAHDLNYARFGYWSRKLGRVSSAAQPRPSKSAFVPVTVEPTAPDPGLHLVLPAGLEIRGIAPDNVALVARLLRVMA